MVGDCAPSKLKSPVSGSVLVERVCEPERVLAKGAGMVAGPGRPANENLGEALARYFVARCRSYAAGPGKCVQRLAFGVWGLGIGVLGVWCGVWSFEFWVSGFGFWILGLGFWVLGLGLGVWCLVCRA